MEKTIVSVEIVPMQNALVTPLELLHDFAGHALFWHFLDQESYHYTQERGTPSGILRHHRHPRVPCEAHFVFAAVAGERSTFRLRMIAPAQGQPALTPSQRQEVIEHFVQAFRDYLGEQNVHARLDLQYEEQAPAAAAA